MEFLPKPSWAIVWDIFIGQNRFLVSDLLTAVCGMGLIRKELNPLNHYCT